MLKPNEVADYRRRASNRGRGHFMNIFKGDMLELLDELEAQRLDILGWEEQGKEQEQEIKRFRQQLEAEGKVTE